MAAHLDEVPRLAGALHRPAAALLAQLQANPNKRFLYLERGLSPIEASEVMALGITGVHQIKEYKRFYPSSELTAQLIGLVNIDGRGQEGTELGFNDWLSGKDGVREVAINPRGSLVNSIKVLKTPKASQDVALSIDLRLQFIAYKALEKAVLKFGAHSGSAVLVNPKSGQILAMANFLLQPEQPRQLRPGLHAQPHPHRYLRAGLGDQAVQHVGGAGLRQVRREQSSQRGTGLDDHRRAHHPRRRPARRTDHDRSADQLLEHRHEQGRPADRTQADPRTARPGRFRRAAVAGLPGENPGYLPFHEKWSNIATASMSFGYSLAVNTAELAQAYSVFANDGKLVPLSLLRDNPQNQVRQAMDPQIARRIRAMLQTVVEDPKGVVRARVPGYHVAGKSGTARKASGRGYADKSYRSLFVGMAPASDPQLVLAVMIDSPTRIGYFGGLVSAPTFSDIMAGSLRALAIPPDNLQDSPAVADRQHHG